MFLRNGGLFAPSWRLRVRLVTAFCQIFVVRPLGTYENLALHARTVRFPNGEAHTSRRPACMFLRNGARFAPSWRLKARRLAPFCQIFASRLLGAYENLALHARTVRFHHGKAHTSRRPACMFLRNGGLFAPSWRLRVRLVTALCQIFASRLLGTYENLALHALTVRFQNGEARTRPPHASTGCCPRRCAHGSSTRSEHRGERIPPRLSTTPIHRQLCGAATPAPEAARPRARRRAVWACSKSAASAPASPAAIASSSSASAARKAPTAS